MSKTVCDKKKITVGIAVRKEKKLSTIKNRYKIYFHFIIFYHILTVKNCHKMYHILTVKNRFRRYHVLTVKNRYKMYYILMVKTPQNVSFFYG